ncbi:MAG: T9SS type A sorting domain-containing protein, partial [Chitinophagales bacterium]|nr:T9SS type A sorting domain-containing protein [Chitinophagales bacterium]
GIQIVPITTGATIGSANLGIPYTGSWTGTGNILQMTFTPNTGNIPTGTTSGLVDLCLNLAPGTSSPQVVLINWLTPGAIEGDSIACTDTILFYCDPPPLDPCGEIDGNIICNEDGTYQYNFTFTNNSTYSVTAIVFTSVTPYLNIIPNPVFPGSPVLPDSSYSGSITIDPGIYPPGTTFCFDLSLADSTGFCCHTMDSICLTLPECGTCACGDWDIFSYVYDEITSLVECNVTVTTLDAGDAITFTGGGYNCIGDSTCTGEISWTLTGPTTASGTGLPSFTLVSSGLYTLTLIGSCNGTPCDTCIIYFDVHEEEEECNCGTWEPFNITDESGGGIDTYNVLCGGTYSGIEPFGFISFNAGGLTCIGDSTCSADMIWIVTGPITASGTGLPSFATTSAGTYTLTMYGYCGGMLCETCVITFIVEEACSCGNWETFGAVVDVPGDADYSLLVECETAYPDIPAGTVINFVSGGYLCIGDATICSSELTWNITGPAASSGTGYPTFTLNTPGTYTLTVYGSCNGIVCDTCEMIFTVIEEEICTCGSWGLFTISRPGKSFSNQECGTGYNWKKGVSVTLNGNYNCAGECAATYSWIVNRNGVLYTNGTGMPVTFTPNFNGNYEVIIYPNCGGLDCAPCTFKFKIKNPVPPGRMSENDTDQQMFMTVAPNPASDVVTIKIESGEDINTAGTILIINEMGEIVITESVSFNESKNFTDLKINMLPAGCYIIKYLNTSESLVQRLIISK